MEQNSVTFQVKRPDEKDGDGSVKIQYRAHIGLRGFDFLYRRSTLVFYDGFGRGKSDTAKDG